MSFDAKVSRVAKRAGAKPTPTNQGHIWRREGREGGTMGENQFILGHKNSLSHERGSERSERSGGRERSDHTGASERVSGASERANGRASGPVLMSRFMAVLNHSVKPEQKAGT